METFADVIRTRAEDDHLALTFEGQDWTWEEILQAAADRVALLDDLVPRQDDTQRHIGILLDNVPDFVFWLLAAGLSGDVVVGVNPTRRGAQLEDDMRHVELDLLVTETRYLSEVTDLSLPFDRERLLDIDGPHYRDLVATHAGAGLPGRPIEPGDIYLLMYSSGTTGAPKAVICSQGRLGRLTEAMTARVSLHRDSVNYLCLPLFHGHAIMMNLATALQAGARIVMVRRFSASGFVDDIVDHQVTYFNYVGRILSYILAHEVRDKETENALELAFGSEASPAEAEALRQRFDCVVREGYGASEGMIRIVPDPDGPSGSLGLPAGEIVAEIRDPDTNRECPRANFDDQGRLLNAEEATGEIVAVGRGPAFEGYYKNPEAMASRLRFDGEDFWTGDLGYRDEDGWFYFAGRSSDWVRVDGENFGVTPVERILERHPDFQGVHAFGIADPQTGDQLVCAVTLRAGASFDGQEVSRFLDHQSDLGTKWWPTYFRVIDDAPLTANGKVNKAPLRATAWVADRVWWRPPGRDRDNADYVPMTDDDREGLRADFMDAGRQNLLPRAAPDQTSESTAGPTPDAS